MKWVTAALVLLNLGLFMWGTWYHQPLVALEVPRPSVDVAPEKIKLLAEPGAHLGRHVLPEGAFANVAGIVDGVVDDAAGKDTE